MDDDSNPWPGDGRATRRELLLLRLARTLEDMRREGLACPVALEELCRRSAVRTRPAP